MLAAPAVEGPEVVAGVVGLVLERSSARWRRGADGLGERPMGGKGGGLVSGLWTRG